MKTVIETRKIDSLKLWDKNPRSIKENRFNELKKSIQELGFNDVLKITEDGTVIGGNMRLRALKELGWTEVPVVVTNAHTDAEILRVALRDNEEFGYYEEEQVAELALAYLDPLELETFELHLGKPTKLNLLTDRFGPEVEEDDPPQVDENNIVSKLGEIYQLGRHRVMCGDSTDAEQVGKLMDGAKADMVFTDPPYGVDYSGRGENTSNKIENDALSIEDTEIMVSAALLNAYEVSREGTTCFVWHADSKPELRPLFERSFINAGWRLAATIIWLKKQASMGYQDYRSRHEPCLYGWKGKKQERVQDRTQTTVWESGRDSNYEHPTQKPVYLAAKAIQNHNPGSVLDLFLGSGSTLVACEQSDRVCYGMELDPKYVDVIRKRYVKLINPEEWEEQWQSLTPVVQP